MGLLDTLGNLSPEQTQGLLGLATNVLAVGGPSLRPTSVGQALGAGFQGFQGGIDAFRQRKMEEEQAKQIAEMRGLQIQNLTGELQDKETARQQSLDAQKVAQQYQAGIGNPTAFAQGVLGNNLSPTVNNAATLEAARSQQPAAADEYSRRIGLANAYRANGLFAQADAAEQAALKFKPEFDQTPRVGTDADGKPFSYVLDKSGNVKRLDGVLPRDEMKFIDLGGKQMAYNPYQLTSGQSFNKTMTAGEAAANSLGRDRLNFDKQQAVKPVFNADVGFVLPPSADNPAGRVFAPQGFTPKQQAAPVEFSKSAAGLVELQSSLKNYKDLVSGKAGSRALSNTERGAELKAAHTSVLMGLKNAMELGALAGPDVDMITNMLADPTSAKGLMFGPSGIAKQIEQTEKYLGNRTKAVESTYGRKVPSLQSVEADNSPSNGPSKNGGAKTFDILPPASQYPGRRMQAGNGTIYKSVDGKWVKE